MSAPRGKRLDSRLDNQEALWSDGRRRADYAQAYHGAWPTAVERSATPETSRRLSDLVDLVSFKLQAAVANADKTTDTMEVERL